MSLRCSLSITVYIVLLGCLCFPICKSERMRGYEHGHAYIQAANRPILLDDPRAKYAREQFASVCISRFAVHAAQETTQRSLLAHNRSVGLSQPPSGSLLYQYWLRQARGISSAPAGSESARSQSGKQRSS